MVPGNSSLTLVGARNFMGLAKVLGLWKKDFHRNLLELKRYPMFCFILIDKVFKKKVESFYIFVIPLSWCYNYIRTSNYLLTIPHYRLDSNWIPSAQESRSITTADCATCPGNNNLCGRLYFEVLVPYVQAKVYIFYVRNINNGRNLVNYYWGTGTVQSCS